MSLGVAIRGGGVAAYATARLLSRVSLPYSLERTTRTAQPAIMLGQGTLQLLRDIFGGCGWANDGTAVHHRRVLWGDGPAHEVSHAALVTSEGRLLEELYRGCLPVDAISAPRWTVLSTRDYPEAVFEREFGYRSASAIPVKLAASAPEGTCWIESLERGWLFLLPEGPARARLLEVGEMDGHGLAESRMIARQIDSTDGPTIRFPSHPRIADPLCGPAWLGCGSAALNFDPVCGEGAGHALREAILAAAVVRAVSAGEDEVSLRAHYRLRLISGFARHLQTCVEFYTRGRRGPWWDEQLLSLRDGLRWCQAQLADAPPPRFRLRDFELEAL